MALHCGLPHLLVLPVVCLAFRDAPAAIATSRCKVLQRSMPCDMPAQLQKGHVFISVHLHCSYSSLNYHDAIQCCVLHSLDQHVVRRISKDADTTIAASRCTALLGRECHGCAQPLERYIYLLTHHLDFGI